MNDQPKTNQPAPPDLCQHCNGNGWRRGIDAAGSLDDVPCRDCRGTGTVHDDHGGNIGVTATCGACCGTGVLCSKDTEWESCLFCGEKE